MKIIPLKPGKKARLALLAGLGASPFAASAALPAAATAAITAVQDDATAMVAAWWPVLAAVFGALLLMKLFKKAGNKAT